MAPSHASLQALQKTQKTCIHHFLRCTSPPLKASTHSALKTVSFHCTGNHCNPLAIAIARQCVRPDRKSTRLNSSHLVISYAVFCLKKKKKHNKHTTENTVMDYITGVVSY